MNESTPMVLEIADQIVSDTDAAQTHDGFLRELFTRSENLEALVSNRVGSSPSAAQIFDAVVYSNDSTLGARLGQNFEVVALPGEIVKSEIHPGDVAIRKIDSESAHVAVISSDQLKTPEVAKAEGWSLESNKPGKYGQVIEAGPVPHEMQDKFARQFADSAGRLLNDLLILRLATPPPSSPTVVNIQSPAKDPALSDSEAVPLESREDADSPETLLATSSRENSLQGIGDGALGKLPPEMLERILGRGENDANDLTNEIFWQRHPELSGKRLSNTDPKQQPLRMEWSNLFRRHVKPLIWLRAMIDVMDRFRGTLPRDFLLGWIAWESDGFLKSTTTLGELGYFQIMWQGGEAQSQLQLTQDAFKKLSSDPIFSLEQGIALAENYRKFILKSYPSVRDGSELLWRLTKGRHAASGILKNAMDRVTRSSSVVTWAAVAKILPAWMVENIDHTLSYAAKLKPFADLVPVDSSQATGSSSGGWNRQLRSTSDVFSERLSLDFATGELLQEDSGSGSCAVQVDDIVYGWGRYKDDVDKLPASEKAKIEKLADLVVASFAVPGCIPLAQISVVGHADHDSHGAELEQKVSQERALSVAAELAKTIIKLWKARSMGPFTKGAIAFDPPPHGVGATVPDSVNVPTITNRERNRRVAITLRPFGAPIPLPPSPLPPKPLTPPGPPPAARTCCILAPSDNPFGAADDNFADPAKLGIHGSSSEVRGLIYTGKAGFVDLGHLRDLCDMTKNVFDQIAFAGAATGTIVKTTHGEAVLAGLPASATVISVARSICFDDSFGYEILTYAVNSPGAHNSSFSPEDLPSNFLGTLVAERAIAAGGRFDLAVSAEIDKLVSSLDPQTKAETMKAFNLINHRWVDFSGVRSLLSNDYLKRRNFTRDPWKTGHPSDSPTPAFVSAGFGFSGTAPYTYTHTLGRRFAGSSFAAEVATIRADAVKRYGADFDKP